MTDSVHAEDEELDHRLNGHSCLWDWKWVCLSDTDRKNLSSNSYSTLSIAQWRGLLLLLGQSQSPLSKHCLGKYWKLSALNFHLKFSTTKCTQYVKEKTLTVPSLLLYHWLHFFPRKKKTTYGKELRPFLNVPLMAIRWSECVLLHFLSVCICICASVCSQGTTSKGLVRMRHLLTILRWFDIFSHREA